MAKLRATLVVEFAAEPCVGATMDEVKDECQRRMMDDCGFLLSWVQDITGDLGAELMDVVLE